MIEESSVMYLVLVILVLVGVVGIVGNWIRVGKTVGVEDTVREERNKAREAMKERMTIKIADIIKEEGLFDTQGRPREDARFCRVIAEEIIYSIEEELEENGQIFSPSVKDKEA